MITDDDALSVDARATLANPANELFLSAASCWEIAIKCRLGKLHFSKPPEKIVPEEMHRLAIQPLPILPHHALHTAGLKPLHRDPFDRLLVAQSKLERLPIITPDPLIKAYGAAVAW